MCLVTLPVNFEPDDSHLLDFLGEPLLMTFTATGPFFVYAPLIIYFCWRWPYTEGRRLSSLAKHAALYSIFLPLSTCTTISLRTVVMPLFDIDYQQGAFIDMFFQAMPKLFAPYFCFTFIAYTYISQANSAQAKLDFSELHSELNEAKIATLQNQLQPHFMFNALNAISSAMYLDRDKADAMLSELGDFLRTVNRLKDQPFINLEAELHTIRQFLRLIELRFADKLSLSLEIDDSLLNYMVPSLLLQPLVENAAKHGVESQHQEAEIRVCVYSRERALVIDVENTCGHPLAEDFPQGLRYGTGLSNITRRLQYLYPDTHHFSIEKIAANRVRVRVVIPKEVVGP